MLCGTGIGALIALEGAQARDDGTLFLVDLLRKANHRVDELEKLASTNTNKEALAAARKSLNVIVSEGSTPIHFYTVVEITQHLWMCVRMYTCNV